MRSSTSYYVLVITCVLARKQEWIKGPCLVATLLIPAVAALHGIVLAAVNVPGLSFEAHCLSAGANLTRLMPQALWTWIYMASSRSVRLASSRHW